MHHVTGLLWYGYRVEARHEEQCPDVIDSYADRKTRKRRF